MDRLQLIAEIHKRPALWDVQNGEYRPRANSQQLWQEVATCMGPNVTVEECKRKWKNVRDSYRSELSRIEKRIEKDILRGTYDVNNDYSSKCDYFDHMKFIKLKRKPSGSKMGEVYNNSSNDTSDDNEFAELDEFSEFQDIDDIKEEPNVQMTAVTSSLKDDIANDLVYDEQLAFQDIDDIKEERNVEMTTETSSLKDAIANDPVHDEQFAQQNEIQETTKKDSLLPPDHAIKINQVYLKPLNTSEEKPCCKCPKRSFDQMHLSEDLEKEERNVIKSTRLDISRSNDLTHVGDSDYNFLVSFLPQLKKMNELQNLQFRAKMTELIYRIMCETPPVSKPN